jgi:hypothetical protein
MADTPPNPIDEPSRQLTANDDFDGTALSGRDVSQELPPRWST